MLGNENRDEAAPLADLAFLLGAVRFLAVLLADCFIADCVAAGLRPAGLRADDEVEAMVISLQAMKGQASVVRKWRPKQARGLQGAAGLARAGGICRQPG